MFFIRLDYFTIASVDERGVRVGAAQGRKEVVDY